MPKSFDDEPAEDNNVAADPVPGMMPAAPAGFGATAQPSSFGAAPAVGGFGSTPAPAMGGFGAAAPAMPAASQPAPAMQQVDTSSFKDATIDPELAKEPWMKSYWRPAMGWLYLAVCAFDFVIFPVMWTVVQFWEKDIANDAFRQWMPLTLQGAGLFHMAMGAVLGIAAWGRTKEKEAGKN